MKKSIVTFVVLVSASFAFLTSCKNQDAKIEDAQEGVIQADQNLVDAKNDSLSDYESFKMKMNQRISVNELKIAELKVKVIDGTQEAKDDYSRKIVQIDNNNKILRAKVINYTESNAAAWEVFKNGLEANATELEKELDEINEKK